MDAPWTLHPGSLCLTLGPEAYSQGPLGRSSRSWTCRALPSWAASVPCRPGGRPAFCLPARWPVQTSSGDIFHDTLPPPWPLSPGRLEMPVPSPRWSGAPGSSAAMGMWGYRALLPVFASPLLGLLSFLGSSGDQPPKIPTFLEAQLHVTSSGGLQDFPGPLLVHSTWVSCLSHHTVPATGGQGQASGVSVSRESNSEEVTRPLQCYPNAGHTRDLRTWITLFLWGFGKSPLLLSGHVSASLCSVTNTSPARARPATSQAPLPCSLGLLAWSRSETCLWPERKS